MVEAPALPVKPGDVLAGKYEVESVLGEGGMGVVVAARHVQLRNRVALKFLLPDVVESPEVAARFLREAQAATSIKSEHVARVLDVGTLESGAPYMVMEYLEGRDLSAVVASEGRLGLSVAVDYLLQAMEALAEAHAAGIVHRDLKPSNLFLTSRADGSYLVKVLDFGISKAVDPGALEANLTATQGMMGSPLYMSPEQIRSSKHVDVRADVWSLGIILYELVSGAPPFNGETATAVLASIIGDSHAPLKSVRTELPQELDLVVDRCLAKSPNGRYPTLYELGRDLAQFGDDAARRSLERILRVTQKGRGADTAQPLSSSLPLAPARTAGAWGTRTAPSVHSRRSLIAVVSAAGVLLALTLVTLLVFRSRNSTPAETVQRPPVASSPAVATQAPLSDDAAPYVPGPSASVSVAVGADAGVKKQKASSAKPGAGTSKIDSLIIDRR